LIKATGGSLARLIFLRYQKTDFQTFMAVKKQKPSFVEKLGFFSYKAHDFLINYFSIKFSIESLFFYRRDLK